MAHLNTTTQPVEPVGDTLVKAALRSPAGDFVDNESTRAPPPEAVLDEVVSVIPSERSPLLGRGTESRTSSRSSSLRRRKKPWYRRPHPGWMVIIWFSFHLWNGAIAATDYDLMTLLACRVVELEQRPANLVSPFVPSHSQIRDTLPMPARISALEGSGTKTLFWQALLVKPVDPSRMKECQSSSQVQRKAASYMTKAQLVAGITISLTTGFWSALSDSVGRRAITALSFFANILDMSCMVIATTWPERFSVPAMIIVRGFVSLLGGQVTLMAVVPAYNSDCLVGQSRVRLFAFFDGLTFAGTALGPLIGVFLIKSTGLMLAPYYFNIGNSILIIFFLAQQLLEAQDLFGFVLAQIRAIVEPLAILMPMRVVDDEEHKPLLQRHDLQIGALDWNLAFVAASYAFYMVVPGIMNVKLLYAKYKFGWTTSEIGPFITFTSTIRLVVLFFVLPISIRYLRSAPSTPNRPRPESPNLSNFNFDLYEAPATDEQQRWDKEAAELKLRADSRFDLNVARISLLIAFVSYAIMAIPSTTPKALLIGTGLNACSAGTSSALSSLGLSLCSPRDSGRFLGALSVCVSLAVLVVGTPFFGAVYYYSVETYPEMIFLAACIWFGLALGPSLAVKLGDKLNRTEEDEVTVN